MLSKPLSVGDACGGVLNTSPNGTTESLPCVVSISVANGSNGVPFASDAGPVVGLLNGLIFPGGGGGGGGGVVSSKTGEEGDRLTSNGLNEGGGGGGGGGGGSTDCFGTKGLSSNGSKEGGGGGGSGGDGITSMDCCSIGFTLGFEGSSSNGLKPGTVGAVGGEAFEGSFCGTAMSLETGTGGIVGGGGTKVFSSVSGIGFVGNSDEIVFCESRVSLFREGGANTPSLVGLAEGFNNGVAFSLLGMEELDESSF